MTGGGCVGLLVGNRAAYLFRDKDALQAATLVFLLCGAVLMEAAGFGDAVQEPVSLAVGGCAGRLWPRMSRASTRRRSSPRSARRWAT